MSTYNAYLNKEVTVGESTPIWLGVVKPIPAGAKLNADYAKAGAFFKAGTAMELKDGIATPLLAAYKVIKYATSSTNSIISVASIGGAAEPATTDFLMKLGATFATVGKAWNPDSVADSSEDGADWDITVATSGIDVVAKGDIIVFSSATAEGSSKSAKIQPNCYLYNDVAIDAAALDNETISNVGASVALVKFHGEGLLINRTDAAPFASQMAAAVPGVMQETRF